MLIKNLPEGQRQRRPIMPGDSVIIYLKKLDCLVIEVIGSTNNLYFEQSNSSEKVLHNFPATHSYALQAMELISEFAGVEACERFRTEKYIIFDIKKGDKIYSSSFHDGSQEENIISFLAEYRSKKH